MQAQVSCSNRHRLQSTAGSSLPAYTAQPCQAQAEKGSSSLAHSSNKLASSFNQVRQRSWWGKESVSSSSQGQVLTTKLCQYKDSSLSICCCSLNALLSRDLKGKGPKVGFGNQHSILIQEWEADWVGLHKEAVYHRTPRQPPRSRSRGGTAQARERKDSNLTAQRSPVLETQHPSGKGSSFPFIHSSPE